MCIELHYDTFSLSPAVKAHRMDKTKAIQIFLERVEHLTRLPLITDAEMQSLFGEEVAAALDLLARLNEKEGFCQNCETRCCPAVRCELYAPQFDRCPIHALRPPVCRLHYCHRFFKNDDTLLKELSDVFFDCLIAADYQGSAKARLFDSPPLAMCCPGLVSATSQWMASVKAGTLDPREAIKLIKREVENYRPVTS